MNSTSTTNSTLSSSAGSMGMESAEAHGALYKIIGVSLAIASGVFIGSSFVFKKKGLLQSTEKSGRNAGEGYGYLKSTMWWTGMILMVVGEACNFVAYAFTQAILVTPLGALSVVLSAVLSSIFLKERLSFQGKVGCLQCVLGAIIIVMHAPEQGAADNSIDTFKSLMFSVGFLVYACLAVSISLFLVFYCGPRWGSSNMLVYICICSLIGSLSVVFTQGIGGAIVHSLTIQNQFTNWFVYLVLILTLVTLAVEIIYLNKALNIFNTAVVTPTYYVIFTTLTIVSSITFYRGFDASPVNVVTCVFGFLIICSGVALLQHSRSEKTSGNGDEDDDEAFLMNDHRERYLPSVGSEKFLSSEEDEEDGIEHVEVSTSARRNSSLWHRLSKPSMEGYNNVELSAHPNGVSSNGYTDNIGLSTINKPTLTTTPNGHYPSNGTDNNKNSVNVSIDNIYEETSSQNSRSNNRRAQDSLDTITSMRLGLKKDNDDDRKGLFTHNTEEDNENHLL